MSNDRSPDSRAEGSLGYTIGLHLLPGVLTTLAYLGLARVLMPRGVPALFALLLATLLVLIPFEFGFLLYQAKRRTGTSSWRAVVEFREPLPAKQYLLWPFLLFVWGFLSSALASPLDQAFGQGLFSWLPDWYYPASADAFKSVSRSMMWAIFLLGLVVGGFLGPIVEELYFRGYLLPRLARFGRWAPLLHAVLFSVYHFWTPWQNPSRLLLMIPMTYLVWWKRNIYLAMIAHCALNAIVWTVTIGMILRAYP
jgi:membrane protease YdiL (CAAX protease family)